MSFPKVIFLKKTDIHLIVMTAYPDMQTFSEAINLGADYIEKGNRVELLIDKIITTGQSS